MRGEGVRLRKLVSVGVIETSDTRTKNLGGDEGGHSSSHVDHTASGEVVHAASKSRVVVESSDESRRTPDGVYHDRVDETSQHDRVAKVGLELAALCYGTSHDGGSSSGEGKLEEPPDVVPARRGVTQEEVRRANEPLLARVGSTVGEGVPDRPEPKSTTARVEDVLEHDIFHVLLADGPGTEHGETALHEEDHSPGEQQVEDIESRRHPGHGRVGVIERCTDRDGGVIARCLAEDSLVEFAHDDQFSA
mmetsp:Transcript_21207/g.47127  ORF Transcript_21207/g.47127 Transcript_21207/m.47127 type:complete len:249 (-) Transcript_21207:141-887(-)